MRPTAIIEGFFYAVLCLDFLDVLLKKDALILSVSHGAEACWFATKRDPSYCNYRIFS